MGKPMVARKVESWGKWSGKTKVSPTAVRMVETRVYLTAAQMV